MPANSTDSSAISPQTSPAAPKGTRSIQRTMSLLNAFHSGEGWLPLKVIAQRVGLPKPTAHRILNALVSTDLVESREDGSYRLGQAASELGFRAQLSRLESPPRPTPFSAATVARSSSSDYREWNGSVGATSFDPTFEREYFAVRGGAGVLDVSPLFLYEFSGPEAERAVQRIVTRDVSRCAVDQVMYTAWCDDDGYLLQDGNLMRLAKDRFRLSAAEPALRWFSDCAIDLDVEVREVTDRFAKLAVQGPLARKLLDRVLDGGGASREAVWNLPYFHGTSSNFGESSVYVSRTGFTGDLGYELWLDLGEPDQRAREMRPSPADALWDALLSTDLGPSVAPIGLEALDALRIEAGLILIGIDYFSASHALLEKRHSTPDEAGLSWAVKLVKGNDFVGRAAIRRERKRGVSARFVGLEIEWDELEQAYAPHGLRPQTVGQPPSREPMPIRAPGHDASGPQIGQVTSSFFSPRLKKQLCLATVPEEYSRPGSRVQVGMRVEMQRALLEATVVKLPFYDPPQKRSQPSTLPEDTFR